MNTLRTKNLADDYALELIQYYSREYSQDERVLVLTSLIADRNITSSTTPSASKYLDRGVYECLFDAITTKNGFEQVDRYLLDIAAGETPSLDVLLARL